MAFRTVIYMFHNIKGSFIPKKCVNERYFLLKRSMPFMALGGVWYYTPFDSLDQRFFPFEQWYIWNKTPINPDQVRILLKTFMYTCGIVFCAWRWAAYKPKWEAVLMKHFMCSRRAIKRGRVHTLITSAFSHVTLPHLAFNLMLVHTLTEQLKYNLSSRDFINLFVLSSICGSGLHILTNPYPVIGSSCLVMSLIWVEGIMRSRDSFSTIIPIPGLFVTSLQLSQMNIGINLLGYWYTKYYKSNSSMHRMLRNVSWTGHLGGIAAGIMYSYYKRYYDNDHTWASFWNLSRCFSARDWQCSGADFRDSLLLIKNRLQLMMTTSPVEYNKIAKHIEMIRYRKHHRRATNASTGIYW